MKIKFLLFSFLLFFAGHSFAVVYKCVDADGKKTFTDSECEKLALKYLNPSAAPLQSVQDQSSQMSRKPSNIQTSPISKPQSQLYVKPKVQEKRPTNFHYIWSGPGYDGFLKYFFSFVGVAGLLFLLLYLLIFIIGRFRKFKSGFAGVKS